MVSIFSSTSITNLVSQSNPRDEVFVASVPLKAKKGPAQLLVSAAYSLDLWDLQHFMVIIKPASPLNSQMADQPVPRADGERVNADIAAALAALTTKMAAMSTQLAEVINKSRRGDRRGELNRVPQVKSDIPLFYGIMGGQEFLNWQLVIQRQRERKVPIRSWRRMKQLMMEQFLPEEYEPIPYKKYVECVQGKKTVMEYTNECVKQELPKPDTKKEDIIVAKETFEEIDELAMLRILSDDFEEEIEEAVNENSKFKIKQAIELETDQGTKQDIQLGTTEYQIPSGPGTKSSPCAIAAETIIKPELVAASSMTISSDSALRLAGVEELISSHNSVNKKSEKPSMIGSMLKSVQGTLNQAKDATIQKAVQAKDYAAEKAREGADYTANKAREAKDTTMQKGGECKDYAAEKAKQGADFTADRAKQAKDTKLEKATEYKDYTADKAIQRKDYAVEKAVEGKDYTAEKAVEGKGCHSVGPRKAMDFLTGKKDEAKEKTYKATELSTEILKGTEDEARRNNGSDPHVDIVDVKSEDDEWCLRLEKVDADKRGRVTVLKVGNDVIQLYKHGPFKVDDVIHLEENSGSSSFEVEETDVCAFDFQPIDPENIYVAMAALSGRPIPGVVLERKMERLPRTRCWFVGQTDAGAIERSYVFNEGWESGLSIGSHDCRDYTNGLVEHLTQKKLFLEQLRGRSY
ncbi:unnamed protein product [Rhodiola kirilowii]